jgi:hypothetical protein
MAARRVVWPAIYRATWAVANAELIQLNAQIHGLQGEIDELQAFAPDHQQCDCRIMRYDCDHAETVDTNSRVSSADGGENGSRRE